MALSIAWRGLQAPQVIKKTGESPQMHPLISPENSIFLQFSTDQQSFFYFDWQFLAPQFLGESPQEKKLFGELESHAV